MQGGQTLVGENGGGWGGTRGCFMSLGRDEARAEMRKISAHHRRHPTRIAEAAPKSPSSAIKFRQRHEERPSLIYRACQATVTTQPPSVGAVHVLVADVATPSFTDQSALHAVMRCWTPALSHSRCPHTCDPRFELLGQSEHGAWRTRLVSHIR